jgi:xanthine permease XanP
VTLLGALQHAGVIASSLVIPLVVVREAGAPPGTVVDVVGLSLLVLAVGAVMQALPRGPVGSGYLCPPDFTAAYLPSSVLAVKTGGLSLVFGMTAFAGVVEAALARALQRLRPYFPPEVSGLVVTALALSAGTLGVRYVLGIDRGGGLVREQAVAAVALATAVTLNVWTAGIVRTFCMLAGMATGTATALALGVLTPQDLATVTGAPWLAVPHVGHLAWSFDVRLAAPFAVAAVASALKAVGNVTTCQQIDDAEWTRPDMRSISRGVAADGLSTVCAGLLGTSGISTASSNVGLAGTTGVTSRALAWGIGGIFLVLAFVPKASAALAVLPRPVIGATLLFASCFVLMSGLRIITSRMLDARKTLVVGMGLLLGVAIDVYAGFFTTITGAWRPVIGSSIVVSTLVALGLNLIFRLGVRSHRRCTVDPVAPDGDALDHFMEEAGAAWGARRDVVIHARFNLEQSIEAIVEAGAPKGPIEVDATFDEFNLDLRLSYTGAPIDLPARRPTADEVIDSPDGARRLAGFMLRRYADRVHVSHHGDRTTLLFHFDH